MAISGGLSTIWGFCRLGRRYFKNRRMLYCAELNSIQPSTTIYAKYSYGSWKLFHSGDNCSEFGAILDHLPIKINVFSHICILRKDLNWTDAVIWHMYYNHNNANHQCNQKKKTKKKQKNAKIIGQNELRVRI